MDEDFLNIMFCENQDLRSVWLNWSSIAMQQILNLDYLQKKIVRKSDTHTHKMLTPQKVAIPLILVCFKILLVYISCHKSILMFFQFYPIIIP